MFIRSNMDVAVTYNKGEHSIVLAPHAITEVDEAIVTEQELKNCYNDRITFIDPKYLDDACEVTATPTVEDEVEEANTGDENVDAFLNGETDQLPEGTTEITEEKANELLETEGTKEETEGTEGETEGTKEETEGTDEGTKEETEGTKEETEGTKEENEGTEGETEGTEQKKGAKRTSKRAR